MGPFWILVSMYFSKNIHPEGFKIIKNHGLGGSRKLLGGSWGHFDLQCRPEEQKTSKPWFVDHPWATQESPFWVPFSRLLLFVIFICFFECFFKGVRHRFWMDFLITIKEESVEHLSFLGRCFDVYF